MMSMIRGLFKLNQGPEWIFLAPHGDLQGSSTGGPRGKKRTRAMPMGPRSPDTVSTNSKQKKATTVAPSSSSFEPVTWPLGRFAWVGDISGIEAELALETYDAMLGAKASGVVILAQPVSMGSTSDP
ncbi:hypothetical protein Nepgr_017891 [Nepenthes gracilis]|uniref:Uncharacterized protein n=1 Tax=Nepenthes gracilis TaxID=150966 RepID=A0AAD3XTT7_NEPGR|nr:hypothetical protein Nepgr_017891 [Nepenthes gracilis]